MLTYQCICLISTSCEVKSLCCVHKNCIRLKSGYILHGHHTPKLHQVLKNHLSPNKGHPDRWWLYEENVTHMIDGH